MGRYEQIRQQLRDRPKKWLITGCAGFVGSNLLETLLQLDQAVVGLDNFSTGQQRNLDEVEEVVGAKRWKRFNFIKGDIRDTSACQQAVTEIDYVLHQAALGSIPRSLSDPITTNDVNINGFLNILIASKNASVTSFVYASSSSTYGDHLSLPKIESITGKLMSPYAVTKYVNELYAEVFARCYGCKTIGLRYFNAFGKRQNSSGAYAAVIPKWITAMINDDEVFINGDGETSRDFCFVENVVQANLLAATTTDTDAFNQIFNIARGESTTLNRLFSSIRQCICRNGLNYHKDPMYRDFRAGDVRHSQADISKARRLLGYAPEFDVQTGIIDTVSWYLSNNKFEIKSPGS